MNNELNSASAEKSSKSFREANALRYSLFTIHYSLKKISESGLSGFKIGGIGMLRGFFPAA